MWRCFEELEKIENRNSPKTVRLYIFVFQCAPSYKLLIR